MKTSDQLKSFPSITRDQWMRIKEGSGGLIEIVPPSDPSMKTFDQLRVEFLVDDPPPADLSDKKGHDYTKAEFHKRLQEEGYAIPERTLSYYITIGLVDRPSFGSKKKGRGRETYFSERSFEKVVMIKKGRDAGYSLKDLKEIFQNYDERKKMESEGVYSDFFHALAKIFVENLPKSITDVAHYTGIAHFHTEIHGLPEWEKNKKAALEILNKAGVKDCEKKFNDIYKLELNGMLSYRFRLSSLKSSICKLKLTSHELQSIEWDFIICHNDASENTLKILKMLFKSD